jgi:serine phosphatase RsbU (regulator of sigma subunit)
LPPTSTPRNTVAKADGAYNPNACMEHDARRFVRRIILIHLVLIGLVLVIVGFAARGVKASIRSRAIDQSTSTQELLAKQTAAAIENFYTSIWTVLESAEPEERNVRRAERATESLWEGVKDRVSTVLVIDAASMQLLRSYPPDRSTPDARTLIEGSVEWLWQARGRAISPVRELDGVRYHLLCVPADRRLLVAVVPVERVEANFLDQVNRGEGIGAMLVDERGVILSNTGDRAVGRNLWTDINDPRIQRIGADYRRAMSPRTEVFDDPTLIGNESLPPSMVTAQPIRLGERKWTVLISANLSQADTLVKGLFREALGWAIFVGVSMSAILLSTAIQLIRGRLRVERLERQVLDREIAEARQIQLRWLPREACAAQAVQIAALNQPATHISGDFYNWFDLDDGRTVVTIGDVTGHGMAAAFLMATTQLLVRNIMPRVADAGACLAEVNRQLCTQAFHGQFVTMLIVVLDPNRCSMELATAGHPPPLIGNGAEFRLMPLKPDLMLAVDEDTRYTAQRFDLVAGTSLVLYTDGVPDAQRPDGQRFSIEGLSDSLHGRFDSAQSILDAVRAAVDEFRQGRDLADDLTVVTIQLQPSPARSPERAAVTA